jgi:hypothetical protein
MPDAILLAQDLSFPLPLGADGAPPREICIFRRGDNKATKGVFFYDDESAAEVLARFAAQGEDLPIDFHHWSEQVNDPDGPKTPEATRAAGWFGLEDRADGLYAVAPPHLKLKRDPSGIYYCADTDKGIRELHWRYFSPAVLYRRMEDGRLRVVGITSLALTHRPSLIGQSPLLASQAGAETNTAPKGQEQKNMDEKALLARAEAAERELLAAKPLIAAVLTLLSASSIDEARGKLQALVEKSAAQDREILSIKREKIEVETKALLSKAKEEKKVSPAEEDVLLKAVLGEGKPAEGKEAEALAHAERQLPWLKGYLSVKAPVVASAANQGKDGKASTPPVSEAPRNQVGQGAPILLSVGGKELKYEELSNLQRQEAKEQDPQLFTAAREDWKRRGSPRSAKA